MLPLFKELLSVCLEEDVDREDAPHECVALHIVTLHLERLADVVQALWNSTYIHLMDSSTTVNHDHL